MEQAIRARTDQLIAFLNRCPTAFHAVEEMAKILEANGFHRLEESLIWNLRPGGSYFVTRNTSSILAFRLPEQKAKRLLLSASHTDSPMFKLKNDCETVAFNTYVKLNAEPYGGMILSSWLDRPLTLAGRLILHRNGCFESKTVAVDRDLLLIPSLAVHQARELANGGASLNPAVDLCPLFAQTNEKGRVKALLAHEAGVDESEIAGMDMFLCNRMGGTVWGADGEFFSAPRIDDLMCAYGCLTGFCEADAKMDSLQAFYCADNEETGSMTKQGAGSAFLSDVLDRICESIGVDRRQLLASSFMVSADNGHAMHPNHPEISDPNNSPKLNGGIVIKSNAAQHYASDGLSAAIFSEICKKAGVPVQFFANRSDLRGGSTLGSISNAVVPLNTVDIGLAQLSMHSAYETAGCGDVDSLVRAMKGFYETDLFSDRDGFFRIL